MHSWRAYYVTGRITRIPVAVLLHFGGEPEAYCRPSRHCLLSHDARRRW